MSITNQTECRKLRAITIEFTWSIHQKINIFAVHSSDSLGQIKRFYFTIPDWVFVIKTSIKFSIFWHVFGPSCFSSDSFSLSREALLKMESFKASRCTCTIARSQVKAHLDEGAFSHWNWLLHKAKINSFEMKWPRPMQNCTLKTLICWSLFSHSFKTRKKHQLME